MILNHLSRRRRLVFRATSSVLLLALLAGCGGNDAGFDSQSDSVGEQGSVRAGDPTLVQSGSQWLSLQSSVLTRDTFKIPCNAAAAVWSKGFAHVPYRVGPTPSQLRDCYEGDAAPDGPGAWAKSVAGSMEAPTLAQTPPGWLLVYSAIQTQNTQRCLGYARIAGTAQPTSFPSAAHSGTVLYCAANGASVSDPELFTDGGQWYLLWREYASSKACDSSLYAQQLAIGTGSVTGSVTLVNGTRRTLLSTTSANIGFDDYTDTACTGAVRQRIDSPTLVRAKNNQLWLFFGANNPASTNHAVGWAKCGTGSPVTGGACTIVSPITGATDSGGRNRPLWGAFNRVALGSGDARPYLPFQDLPGFGGLSLRSVAASPGVPAGVIATAHQHVAANSVKRQLVLRVDTEYGTPGLREGDAMTWHGELGTHFPTGEVRSTTSSGQLLATRNWVNKDTPWAWTKGRGGIFNAMTNDGTLIVGGGSAVPNAYVITGNDMIAGAYNPRTGVWQRIPIKTDKGSLVVPESEPGRYGGSSIVDVEALEGGEAVAFTATSGYPLAYLGRPPPAEGIWPAFGIITKDATTGEWRVASGVDSTGAAWTNQWTGGQLGVTNGAVSRAACPLNPTSYLGEYANESACRGLNELAQFPDSKHVIIAQITNSAQAGTPPVLGLMALEYLKSATTPGRYTVSVKKWYQFPAIPDWSTWTEANPGTPTTYMEVQPKEVQTDPKGLKGDERFSLAFDVYPQNRSRFLNVIMEFSYNSNTGEITPKSAPLFPGARNTTTQLCDARNSAAQEAPCGGYGTAAYDNQGNLWANGDRLGVYTKAERSWTGNCAYDSAVPNLGMYTTQDTVSKTKVWGRKCQPTFDIDGVNAFSDGIGLQLGPDPSSNTMVLSNTSGGKYLIPIRWTGSIRADMTFTVGNTLSSDVGTLSWPVDVYPKWQTPGSFVDLGYQDARPGKFDKLGTFWWSPQSSVKCQDWFLCGEEHIPSAYEDRPSYVGSSAVASLFDPQPVVLPTTPGASASLAVENTYSMAMVPQDGIGCVKTQVGCPIRVARTTPTAPCPWNPNNDPGFVCSGGEVPGASFANGIPYKVWVPADGPYEVWYRLRSWNPTLRLSVDGVQVAQASYGAGSYREELAGPPVTLIKGLHELRISGSGLFDMDSFKLIRK